MKYTAPLFAFALVGALASCSDDTATLGTGVLPGFDKIATSQATYSVTSRSIKMDSVLANTSTCYLGSIVVMLQLLAIFWLNIICERITRFLPRIVW